MTYSEVVDVTQGDAITLEQFNQMLANLRHVASMVAFAYKDGNGTMQTQTIAEADPGRSLGRIAGEMEWGAYDEDISSGGTRLWLMCDGRTFGSASSGADIADDDTELLFYALWDHAASDQLPIYTSAGAASTKGASASADWTANKRLTLPDARGRMPLGADNLGGSSANRVVDTAADRLFADNDSTSGPGEDTVTLTTNQIPAHNHTVPTVNSGAAGSNNVAYESANASTGTLQTNNRGSGQPHNNMPPWLTLGAIIFTGAIV